MTAILRAEHVVRRLSGEVPVTLVDDISLTIGRGEFISIAGPSGSGKSSLLYLLGLLDAPTSGGIWLDGEETTYLKDDQLAQRRLEKLGFVFQFHFLLAEFTAIQNVALPMRRLGKLSETEVRARAAMLLEQLGIGSHASKFPHQLSGGERQRVAVARALANDPLVVLADEPTGNLDSVSSAKVQGILRSLAHDLGKTVISVTHDPAFAASADRHIKLVDGRVDSLTTH